jgi:FrmR/RcnR family transcriptional regulator, repressor of frmRAB operon
VAHTTQNKKKLILRVSRLRGQVNALEKALENEQECSDVLQLLAACRGAINALMAEVMEGHVKFHVLDSKRERTAGRKKSAEVLIAVIRRYLK